LKPSEVVISCIEVFRLISDYVDGDVDPTLRARMEAHFKDCDHCSAVLDGTNNVVRLVGNGQTFEVPANFRKKLYTKLDAHLKKIKKSN
jgi:anti-sigma factor (TIGR02949 family)